MEFIRLCILFCVLQRTHCSNTTVTFTTIDSHGSSLPNSSSLGASEITDAVKEASSQTAASLSNFSDPANTSPTQPTTTTSPTTTMTTSSNTTTLTLGSFLSMLINTFVSTATNSTTTANTTSPTTSKLPDSLLTMANKIPGGMGNSLLPLLMGGGSIDLETITRVLKSLVPQLPSILRGLTQSNTSGLTADERTCSEDVDTYLNDLVQGKMWALSMFDASGKPATSILEGATTFYGNFDECLDVISEVDQATGRQVKGDTCVVSILPPPQLLGMMGGGNGGGMLGAQPMTFNWHLCLPSSCGSRSVQGALQSRLSQVNLKVARVVCHAEIKSGPVSSDSAAVGAIVLTAILGCLVIVGSALDMSIRATKGRRDKVPVSPRIDAVRLTEICTTFNDSAETSVTNGNIDTNGLIWKPHLNFQNDGIDNPAGPKIQETNGAHFVYPNGGQQLRSADKQHDNKNKPKLAVWQRVLLCFSAVSNGEKILSVKRSPASITCLHGIRVLSIGWVILGHTYLYFIMSNAENPKAAMKLMQGFSFQIMINATLSVDSFFVLSGLLVTYLFLKETEKAGGLKVKHMILYYVHRFWRLTPTYAYLMFIYTFLLTYLADGPTWAGPYDKKNCEDYCWTSLVYINNVYKPDKQCMAWGWYLANDMQFYVIAPLALIPWALSSRRMGTTAGKVLKAVGVFVVLGYLICSVVTTASLTHKYNTDLFSNGALYFEKVYQKPWCRIGTFAIGMMLGYILHAMKQHEVKMSPFLQGVGWLLALVAAGACTLATYDANAEGRPGWGVEARTAHETLYRPVWGLVLAWVIFMCCKGKAGIVNWMLSWDWWQPLSRLTYGAYLIHLMFILTETSTARSLIYFTSGYIVYRFFGYVCMSYIFSFLLAILVEAPLLQLEKLVLS
ncbi:O-acyltransferase like protein-like [Haliotis rufescens]|uniref:O-acyltransferase like protein-like n=1 Tax=Haliotis rufescens TaxID=6454 RepID=UPI00201EA219|nr:O-acyltransferase like protein-like [Haliotis rufescens]